MELSDKLSILHIECAQSYGGSVRCLENFIRYSSTARFNNYVLAFSRAGAGLLSEQSGIEVISRPAFVDKVTRYNRIYDEFRYAFWLKSIIRRYEIDLVFLNNGPEPHLGALLATRWTAVPLVSYIRSLPRSYTNLFIKPWIHAKSVNYIAVSQIVKQGYVAAGLPEEKITVIHDGTEIPPVPRRKQASRQLVVGCLGRLVKQKRHLDLIRAVSLASEHAHAINLIIMGNCDPSEPMYSEQIHDEIHKYGLKEQVEVLPFSSDIEGFMDRIDILANPSSPGEAFGTSILEAMARGIPVIATNIGGPREIVVDRKCGFLVTPEKSDELAAVLLELCSRPDICIEMGAAARQRTIEKFDIRERVHDIEQYILNSVSNNRNRLAAKR